MSLSKKHLFVFFLILFTQIGICNVINSEILKNEITKNNEIGNYNQSILKLDEIIHHPKATNYDLYNAYLLKYLTYKTLLNYPEAEINLNIAEKYGLKDKNHKNEIEIRILVERIFIEYDYLRFENIHKLIKEVNQENLKYLDAETHSFFISVLATIEIMNKNYDKAETALFEAVKILEKKSPKHLPNIYRKLLHFYTDTKESDKAINAFDKGIFYAKKYQMRLYTLNMYESLTWHYAQNENWEKAYKTRIIVNQLATDYDAGNQSGKIQSLERKILNKRNDLELRNQKNIKLFLGTTSVIFIILLLVLFKLYKTNQEKRKLVENENNRIRAKLSDLMNKVNDKEITLSNYQLSDRQLEIIDLVKKGLTNKEIATRLYISENTVKYHLKIIYNTLGIDSRNSL